MIYRISIILYHYKYRIDHFDRYTALVPDCFIVISKFGSCFVEDSKVCICRSPYDFCGCV